MRHTKPSKPKCSHPGGCTRDARTKGRCSAHYQAQRRRQQGVPEAEDLGEDPGRLEAKVRREDYEAVTEHAGEAGRSSFLRRAVRTQLLLERAAGRPVTL